MRLLSIIPYPFLPPNNGGRICIEQTHIHIGKQCDELLICTQNNSLEPNTPFRILAQIPNSKLRYTPFLITRKIYKAAKQWQADALMCEHPYMAPSVWLAAILLKKPWFIRSHNIEATRFQSLGKIWWPLLFAFEKWAHKKAAASFFITQEDAHYALEKYHLKANQIAHAPFGTPLQNAPQKNELIKTEFCKANHVDASQPILYFLGALDYRPNEEAVENIVFEIYPRLLKQNFQGTILIIGKGLNPSLQAAIQASNHIRYVGFVNSLSDLFHAADLMINPMQTGGGIKTKVIEALANNIKVVSTENGANGIYKDKIGEQLQIVDDLDWDQFSNAIGLHLSIATKTENAFYTYYNWDAITRNMISTIEEHLNSKSA